MSQQGESSHTAVREFLAEAEEIVDQLGSELADLADMADSGELNPDLLNSIFRGAHSLKGLAGMFGFSGIAELSHTMESLLDRLRLGRVNFGPPLIAVLFESHELLTALVRTVAEGVSSARNDEIADCISRITACLAPQSEMPRTESPFQCLGLSERVLGSLTEFEEHRLLDNLTRGKRIFSVHASFDLATFDRELEHVTDLLKTYGEVISTLPGMSAQMETHIDFDILFGSSLEYAGLAGNLEHEAVSLQLLWGGAETPGSMPQAPPAIRSVPALMADDSPPPRSDSGRSAATEMLTHESGDEAVRSAKSMSRTVRVDIGKLDELMNIVGELVLAQAAISGVAIRMRTEGFSRMAVDLGKAAKGLERKLGDLQKGVMEIRMIPVGQLYEKMSRIVRKISREQGKKVELRLVGADTELDKLIVEDISDPVMHIVRNAIDHGIESPQKRLARGKDEKGTIRISSYQKGNHVVIEIEDDGNGIDLGRVKEKALQNGLITDGVPLSDRDALDLIFLPGFSTSDTVSEVSGRGVGMDVVRNNIAAVSGIVEIDSRPGESSRFIITLPITLAIIKALIISCAGRTYALPITSIKESLLLTASDIKTIERKEVIEFRDHTLPLLRLENFFAIDRTARPPFEFYVVVVGIAEKRLGIVVDDLLGQQDIVIKSLGESFRHLRGISGATDLGERGTILVLDIGGMITETIRTGN
jgi:two-component system chemotaxis sensor kinase CheA